MEVTPKTVKAWLTRENRSREWLGEKCDAAIGTVNNWLSSPRGLPSKAVLIIERLMAIDDERRNKAEVISQNLVIDFTSEEFDLICDAALKQGKKVKPWAKDELMTLASVSMAKIAQRIQGTELRVAERSQPYKTKPHTIRSPYAVAAGTGNDGDDIDELSCWGQYPADHFGVRVLGDSMDDGTENAIPDGSLAICKPMGSQPYAAKGRIYAWSTPDGNCIKRYNTKKPRGKDRIKVLESLNPEFADILVTEDMQAIGEFVCIDTKA